MIVAWEPLWPYRAVLAVDARNFSDLTSKQMQQINADIQQVLAQALTSIGLSAHWRVRMFGQHTGDGYVAGMDPEVLPALVTCFPGALHETLVDWRRAHVGNTPLQLRVSVHVGPLPDSGLGVPMVDTHRMLDDDALRRLLARTDPHITTTAVIISERVYEDVFGSGCTLEQPGQAFVRHLAKVKKFARPSWLHLPGFDWGLADPGLFELPEGAGDRSPGSALESKPALPGIQFHQHGNGSNVQGYYQNFHNNKFGVGEGRTDVE